LLTVGLVLLIFVVLSGGYGIVQGVTHPTHQVGLTTVVTATRGTSGFSDNFSDSGSGWPTNTVDGSTASYSNGGFTVNAPGIFIYRRESPYRVPMKQIGVTMTAITEAGALHGGEFGPNCDQGTSTSDDFHYEFLLTTESRWFIVRHQGVSANQTQMLKEGTAPVAAGSSPETVTGLCATQGDGHTTRLVMFVNGAQVADITDSQSLPASGWIGGMSFGGHSGSVAVVTATQFTVRNLLET
jgi:hypothetical protein